MHKILCGVVLLCLFHCLGSEALAQNSLFGLGVQIQDHTDPHKGVVVVGIDNGSPAENRLEVGDTINFIDGERVEDPELFSLFIQDRALKEGAGARIELVVEKSIGRLYQLPIERTVVIPIAYHGGNYDYGKFNSPLPALLAGVLDGATYKFGAELYCLLEYTLSYGYDHSVDPVRMMNACIPNARAAMEEYRLAQPRTYAVGEMSGGVFFSIQDLMRKRAGKLLGSERLGECVHTVTGETADAIIWLQRDGDLREVYERLMSGRDLGSLKEDIKNSGKYAIIGGVLQCTILRGGD